MVKVWLLRVCLVASAIGATIAPVWAQKTLKVVQHSDLKILDPIWSTAYIVRNHQRDF